MSGNKRAQKWGDEAFIRAVRDHDPASTKEIATELGCTRRTAENRLKTLREKGILRSKSIGRTLVWMVEDTRLASYEAAIHGQRAVAARFEAPNKDEWMEHAAADPTE